MQLFFRTGGKLAHYLGGTDLVAVVLTASHQPQLIVEANFIISKSQALQHLCGDAVEVLRPVDVVLSREAAQGVAGQLQSQFGPFGAL